MWNLGRAYSSVPPLFLGFECWRTKRLALNFAMLIFLVFVMCVIGRWLCMRAGDLLLACTPFSRFLGWPCIGHLCLTSFYRLSDSLRTFAVPCIEEVGVPSILRLFLCSFCAVLYRLRLLLPLPLIEALDTSTGPP